MKSDPLAPPLKIGHSQDDSSSNAVPDQVDIELLKLYFQHQFDRFSKVESGNHALSNIVIAFSAASLVYVFGKYPSFDFFSGILTPIVLVVLNIFSALYISRGYEYMLAHHKRAYKLLRSYSPRLGDLSDQIPIGTPNRKLGRTSLHKYMHYFLLAVALTPTAAYFAENARSWTASACLQLSP